MIENIGNPKVTRVHLAELQTFYEAQLEAYRHYTALQASLKPLQDAAHALRVSGVVDVDALLSQPVSATKAMIDELADTQEPMGDDLKEAWAENAEELYTDSTDEMNDLTPHEGEDEDEPCVRGICIPEGFTPWMGQYGFPADVDKDDYLEIITANGIIHRHSAYAITWKWATEVHTISDVVAYRLFKFGEDEGDPQAYAETLMANAAEMGVDDAFENLNKADDIMQDRAEEIDAPAYETVTGTETDIPPMPEGDGWKLNTGDQPFAAGLQVEVFCRNGAFYLEDVSEFIWPVSEGDDLDIIWYRKAQPVEQEAEPERKFKAGDRVRDTFCCANGTVTGYTGGGRVEFRIDGLERTLVSREEHLELIVDHAAEATAQIEAQAETESTETEAETVTFDLPEGAKMTGTGYSSSGGAFADYVVPETGATGRVYATEGGVGSFQLAVHSHSEPSPHTDEPEAMMEIHLIGGQSIGYIEDDEPETAETVQATAEPVGVEPEAAATSDETVTEQPETASDDVEEDEDPRWQADPSGKWTEAYKRGPRGASDEMIETGDKVTCSDFEGERLVLETQWVVDEVIGWSLLLEGEDQMFDSESCSLVEEKPEVIAPVGSANFDPRVQSDDIAAAEREEFNRPRVHNPWFTAKAEG